MLSPSLAGPALARTLCMRLLFRSLSSLPSPPPPGGRRGRPPKPTVLAELARCADLRRRTAAVNARGDKMAIIAEYPDLRPLLEYVYAPSRRFGLTARNLRAYLPTHAGEAAEADKRVPDSLLSAFQQLSARRGNAAKAALADFLAGHGVLADEAGMETFCRLLDRGLNAGWGAGVLSEVPWKGDKMDKDTGKGRGKEGAGAGAAKLGLGKFEVALCKTIAPPFAELWKAKRKKDASSVWYVSRKLDGVRCLAVLDIRAGVIEDITFLSRQGNAFTSLGALERELVRLSGSAALRAWLANVGAGEDTDSDARLVLDGEVCVVRHAEHGVQEDFHAAVGAIRREREMSAPTFFVLDALAWDEFNGGGGRAFGARHADVRALCSALGESVVALEQTRVRREELDALVRRAAEEGWEGLVFRADRAYRPRRTSDMYKFKQWLDGEYAVTGLSTSVQRLSIGGQYGEYEACAQLWIEHGGVTVGVGSGMSNEQRLRWGRDPGSIVGKQITVEYFGETVREGEKPSLRFPRLKHVWEEGERSV